MNGQASGINNNPKATGPLKGVKILDLSTAFSGPICSSILADQGADIIKVETPGIGDIMRVSGASRNGMSGPFQMINRGKRSIAINMKSEQGVELVKSLMAKSDVVIQNFRHGVVERLGLDYDNAKSVNPEIIYLSINGFGDSGPMADWPVYDNVMQAFGGFVDLQRDDATGKPDFVKNLVCDKTTALYASQALTAALFARANGQGGQHVQVSMLDCSVNFLWVDSAMEHALPGEGATPARPLGKLPFTIGFKNGDGSVSPAGDKAFHGMCKTFGVDSSDPGLASLADRMQNVKGLTGKIAECAVKAAEFDADEAIEQLNANDVPCAKVMAIHELPDHPQAKATALFQRSQHPVLGDVIEPRPAAKFSETPSGIGEAAPSLGQDTDAILEELGFADKVATLRETGVVQ